ncbi:MULTISPECIES: type VII secretion-associated serine protease mycosin [unclassified Mycobacterium]|uniref:type VII secretion-associated serine protease mycosin n=1 Tax=unclassified Mycobacterium TaxID=2642494 RepID=UPI0007403454|nr:MULTISPECIES: type VII secretion-associated serine protease mycosin [unclassified Mycobacterium]KUH81681.1 type VII secretion-associated serine protease mycosin [Mycobacterium sp. GA-0227b]KUH83828.1 type VII secretion-associated serine protease mycosin [Mycobacterium sp. GA-1999]
MRIVLAAAFVSAPWAGTFQAAAITPPTVDDSRLPNPGSPVPPRRTEQTEQCVAANGVSVENDVGDQLDDLDMQSVWRLSRGAGQTVAVIDTGVSRHRLLPHLVPGGDFVSSGDGTEDCDGHGTIVAGIVGAAPDPDTAHRFSGIAPDATIIGIRQSSNKFRAADDPGGSGFGDVDTLAGAVRTAADMGATVINVSTVACVAVDAKLDDRALGAALAYAVEVKNVVVVAAAGNVGAPGQCPHQNSIRPGRPDWNDVKAVVSPAWYDDYVLTVGSIAPNGRPSEFSLAGPWVDVAAPGERVVSLDRDGEGLTAALPTATGEKPLAGTSYAAPVVAGVVAILRSLSPELTARQVMRRIEETARHPAAGWDPVVGHGVVDALGAVTGGSPPVTDPDRAPVVSVPAPALHDGRSADIAVRGAAICLGVVVAVIATTLSGKRLRGFQAIPRD